LELHVAHAALTCSVCHLLTSTEVPPAKYVPTSAFVVLPRSSYKIYQLEFTYVGKFPYVVRPHTGRDACPVTRLRLDCTQGDIILYLAQADDALWASSA